jgi:beta-N-acetylhexosaminidase
LRTPALPTFMRSFFVASLHHETAQFLRYMALALCATFLFIGATDTSGPRPDLHGEVERGWVEETLASLTLREKVAQLVMPRTPGAFMAVDSPEFERVRRWVEEDKVGGFIVSMGSPHTYAATLNDLQALAEVPLLVTADMENGPGMRLARSYSLPDLVPQGGGTVFPPMMAFGAATSDSLVYEMARVLGREARAVGVHLTFGPVLDVNNNPLNPVINTRSFGEDPAEVARLAGAYIRGARAEGLLTTGKHFPGHGDTEVDSHIDLPRITADRARLDTVELPPFRAAIADGVDAIMMGHIAMVGVDGIAAPPATLSRSWTTEVLRGEMGFEGLVVTDAMTMGALTRHYGVTEALLLALEAGSDVLLTPRDPRRAIRDVLRAVENGRISEERIDASVRRVLRAKVQAGLHEGTQVDLEAVTRTVGVRAHQNLAEEVAARSLVRVRDRDGLIPLASGTLRVLSVTYAGPNDLVAGRAFDREVDRSRFHIDAVRVDARTSPAEYAALEVLADSADVVLASVYVSPRAYEGSVAVERYFPAWTGRLAASGKPVLGISFGSPYLADDFDDVHTFVLAWGGAEVSQRAAARALLGEAPITGRLPVMLGRDPAPAVGQETATVPPSSVGMRPDLGRQIDAIVEEAIADGVSAGAAVAIGRHGQLVHLRGYGRLDWDVDSPAADERTIWDLASLTKVVGTTTAAMILEEEGLLDLDLPVRYYLPELDASDKRAITARMLLAHRAGFEAFAPLFRELRGPERYLEAINARPLRHEPGTTTLYSDWSLIVLQQAMERIAGMGLDDFVQKRIFEPLGMTDSGFRPSLEVLERVAPTQVDESRGGLIHGEVHDPNAWAIGGVAGHAGLFSSVADLAVFAKMMLDGGKHEGVRILRPETIARWTAPQHAGSSRALGWDTPAGRSSAGRYFGPRSFGHTGYTGTSIWIDPAKDLFVILLTNRVNPTDANQKHVPLRRAVADAVQQAITDAPLIEWEARR